MKITPELLHRYYDKELSNAEALEVNKALSQDSQLRAQLEELRNLSVLLRDHGLEQAKRASFAGVFERIEQGIAPQPPWWERFRQAWQDRRAHWRWVLPLGVTAAAAAAVMLVLRTQTPPAQPLSAKLPTTAVSSVAPFATGAGTSEIVQVDMGENIGTVIDIEAEDGEHVAVLWVDEPEQGNEPL